MAWVSRGTVAPMHTVGGPMSRAARAKPWRASPSGGVSASPDEAHSTAAKMAGKASPHRPMKPSATA